MAYKAFISYSHAADGQLAPALQSGLQQFAKPWYRLRALDIFRDGTSLAVNPALWPSIENALRDSEYLLLMASPESAGSLWVGREVEWWLTHRDADHLLIILTDGELAWDEGTQDFDRAQSTAVPQILYGTYVQEPLWLDLRWAKTQAQVATDNPRFRDAVGDLASTLHGRPKDELVGEDVRQHRRRQRLARSAITGLVVLTLASMTGAWVAYQQRERALAALQRGDELIQYMLFELRDKLQPIGQLELLDNVNERAMAYYDSFDDEPRTADTLRRQAAGLFNRSQVSLARGDLQTALTAIETGIDRLDDAIKKAPGRTLLHTNHAALTQAAGDILVRMGESAKALGHYQAAGRRIQGLLQQRPDNPRLLRHLGVSRERSGDVLIALGRLEDAHTAYRQSFEISQRLGTPDPGQAHTPAADLAKADLGMAHDKLGRVLLALGQIESALDAYRRSSEIFASLHEEQPDDHRWLAHVAMSQHHLAEALAEGGQLDTAQTQIEQALARYQDLVTHDPDNSSWRRDLSATHNTQGDIAKRRGDWRAARAAYQVTAEAASALADADPANREWQRDLAIALLKQGQVAAEHGALEDARHAFEQALEIRRRLAVQDPDNLRWQSDLADSYAMLAEPLARQGKLDASIELLDKALTINQGLVDRQPENLQWLEALSDRNRVFCNRLDMQGQSAQAGSACAKALAIAQRLVQLTPQVSDRQWRLARSHSRLAEHHLQRGALDEAKAAFIAARDTLGALAGSDPQHTRWQEDLATLQRGLSDVLFRQENFEEGLKAFQAALRIRLALAERDPENHVWQRALALAYERAADIAILAMDNQEGAMALYRRSFKIYHEARQRAPSDLRNLKDLAAVVAKMGDLFWRRQDFDKALTAYADAARLQQAIVDASDTYPDAKQALAERQARLGKAQLERGRHPAAVASLTAAESVLAALFAGDREQTDALIDLARTTELLGSARHQSGDLPGALTTYQTLADHFDQLLMRQPEAQHWVLGRAHAERLIADVQLATGDLDAAVDHFGHAIALLEQHLATAADTVRWQGSIAQTALHAGKAIAAIAGPDAAAAVVFLKQAKTVLQAVESKASLDDQQRLWLAEIDALLKG